MSDPILNYRFVIFLPNFIISFTLEITRRSNVMTRFKFGYLLSTILTLLFSIAFGLLMIVINNQHKNAMKGYDSYSIRTYTYVSSKKVKRYKSGSIYEIIVIEEDKPLIVYNIAAPAVDNKLLSSLNEGEAINVYINTEKQMDEYSYEVVDIKYGDNIILSLAEHQKRGKNNALAGYIFVPLLSLMMLGVSIYFLVKFIKEN